MFILVAVVFMENPSPFSRFRGALLKSGKGCCFVLAILGFLSSVVIVFIFFNLGKNFLICFNYFFYIFSDEESFTYVRDDLSAHFM